MPWVRVWEYPKPIFDDHGFWAAGDEGSRVAWDRIRRVAAGYEIHSIVIVDWHFWAFQTDDPAITYWVDTDFRDRFSEEVHHRFGDPRIPDIGEWCDSEYCIRSYVIWPPEELGQPMYIPVKRHWWSWSGKLAYGRTD